MQLRGAGESFFLEETDMPTPMPQPGEILIQVKAAGITPAEVFWYPTSHTPTGEARLNAVPSHEFSGLVAALGEGVEGLEVGQSVYGMNDWFTDGALAEYCLTKPEWIATKPTRLTHEEAASVPISAQTAWQGLFNKGNLQPGDAVLIHGGSGSVGAYAVQLAHDFDAEVIATCSTKHVALVEELGASRVIDYKTARFENELNQIDLVFDTVGGETLERSWDILKPEGRMVTIASASALDESKRVKAAFFIVETKQEQLIKIAAMLEDGSLQPLINKVTSMNNAESALKGTLWGGKGFGKVVVTIPDSTL